MGSTNKNKVQSDKRTLLAFEYIRGKGIEIGAFHQPLAVPKNVEVLYVDRPTKNESKSLYSEFSQGSIVKTEIIDDVQTLDKIKDESFDFCIANQVLQHMKNPIGSLVNWLGILKPGGILYISILDMYLIRWIMEEVFQPWNTFLKIITALIMEEIMPILSNAQNIGINCQTLLRLSELQLQI